MALTDDTLFRGNLICRQHKEGYRFSVDAVLVAHFCNPAGNGRVLDLGCGCGIIGLILCHRYPQLQLTGLELQPGLARLARSNVADNMLQQRFQVVEGDLCRIKDFMRPESFDLVVSNPPYRRPGSGRVNRENESALARHELAADLSDVVSAAAFCVKNRGQVVCIYPAERLAPLLSSLQEQRLVPKRLQPVYSYPEDDRARLVMVEALKNGGEGLLVLPPFYIYSCVDGPYSRDMAKLYV